MTRNVLLSCLVVSVILNLVAVGYFFGKRLDRSPLHPAFRDGAGISHVLRPLEEARRSEILEELRPQFGEMREVYRDLAARQRDLHAVATSSNYDAEELRESLERFNEVKDEARNKADEALLQAMSKLTDAERRTIFEKAMPARRIRDMREEHRERRPRQPPPQSSPESR